MSALQKINTRNIILALVIIAAAGVRLLTLKYPVLSNFTPVGAIAIFGGVYFQEKWKAYLTVLLTFVVSDVIINHAYTSHWSLWSSDTFWNCVCFSITVFVGSLIKKLNLVNGIVVLLAPVTIHWLIMDLPWINGAASLYPYSPLGYWEALVAAIPFEKNMFLGDVVFGIILFGGFELAKSKFTILRANQKLAL
ncbi:DUF6580 family putative transport protein [Mucilaginibacter sp. UR6-11]|uniref:DUF6580 family putative transport protein n=1 Tax=Mucilaginibacter sp. UR6-11 TaxID=1435644 RepID=UPI001E2A1214|nr:DUF6580 family putative transport protein [Mucilaginibacter sp. UR6-11]MCC8426056.1 hypothetical protein [Mucilaginibacter sp. UR6-11]